MSISSTKKLFLILQNSQEKTCGRVSFFNKNVGLLCCKLINNRLKDRRFPVDIAKFMRTIVLKNISERFPTLTNNITSNIESEEVIFSKTKQKKTQLHEKELAFS